MATQGKWMVYSDIHDNGLFEVTILQENDGEEIATLNTAVGNGDGREAELNAILIGTAVKACKEINPDNPQVAAESLTGLLEALKELVQWGCFLSGYALAGHAGEEPEGHPLNVARKAIAKAEGK